METKSAEPPPEPDDNQVMTSSYHEIIMSKPNAAGHSGSSSNTASELLQSSTEQFEEGAKKLFDKARHYWVGDLSREGIVSQEGRQVTYVAQDLNEKIKLASPTKDAQTHQSPPSHSSEKGGYAESEKYSRGDITERSSLSLSVHSAEDVNSVINDIELEAKKLASSIDSLNENLTGVLHSLSSMTVDCAFVACDGVTQLCDTADASIKVMYQVMAKCEELNKAVKPIYAIQQQLKDTKRLLDKVEAEL